jgi:hypothetical protein
VQMISSRASSLPQIVVRKINSFLHTKIFST